VDLIMRLRADAELPSEAERLAGTLSSGRCRCVTTLTAMNHDVARARTMLHVQAARAIERLRAYRTSRGCLMGLGDWSQRRLVVIEHERVPDNDRSPSTGSAGLCTRC
jgi:hypothetical protein